MVRNTPKKPVGVGRTLAASFAATAALASAGATKDFTILDSETPAKSVVVDLGTEVTYSAPGAPERIQLNLGMDNKDSQAAGEYAKKFSEDPAALRISQDNINQVAQTIISLKDVGVVLVDGWSSDEDDQKNKGYGKISRKNIALAEIRGMVASQMLQDTLQKLGSSVQVKYNGGVENLLTPAEHKELLDAVDMLTAEQESYDELEVILDRMTDMYNADPSSVPSSLSSLFRKLLDEQRGAGVSVPYIRSELNELGKQKENCVVVTKSGTIEYPAKKHSGITITGFLPIPIILRRRRKSSDPLSKNAQDIETKIGETTSELREVAQELSDPYYVHEDGVPEESCAKLTDSAIEKLGEDIGRSRKLRGKLFATPPSLLAIDMVGALTYLIKPLYGIAWKKHAAIVDRNVDRELDEYKNRAAKTPRAIRTHAKYNRRLKAVMIPLALVVGVVSAPHYYGHGADSNGCETTEFAPNGYKPWTSEEECKQIAEDEKFNIRPRIGTVTDFSEPAPSTPTTTTPSANGAPAPSAPPTTLPLDEQTCVAQHPDAVVTRYVVKDGAIELGK